MSLSREDDPRNWALPGASRPPFHARNLYYDLTKSERALVNAFDELCSGTCRLWASLETYALHSALSSRHVYNLIHGRDRNGRHTPGFIERGILTVEAEAKPPCKGRRYWTPAIYVFHEAAIPLDPKALARQDARRRQPTLPGIPRRPMRGEPFDNRNQVPRQPEPVADDSRNQVPRQPEPVAEDSKAFDSRAIDSRERGIQKQPALSLDDQEGEKTKRELAWAQQFVRR